MQYDVLYGTQPWGLPLDQVLLPEYLKRLGYISRVVGKWHLGNFHELYTPTFRGFDSHYGYWLGNEDYYSHISIIGVRSTKFKVSRSLCIVIRLYILHAETFDN